MNFLCFRPLTGIETEKRSEESRYGPVLVKFCTSDFLEKLLQVFAEQMSTTVM